MVDTGTAKRIELIGLATDAGASARGATMGPEALRIAELAETLEALGHTVRDRGDFRPEESGPKPERRRARRRQRRRRTRPRHRAEPGTCRGDCRRAR